MVSSPTAHKQPQSVGFFFSVPVPKPLGETLIGSRAHSRIHARDPPAKVTSSTWPAQMHVVRGRWSPRKRHGGMRATGDHWGSPRCPAPTSSLRATHACNSCLCTGQPLFSGDSSATRTSPKSGPGIWRLRASGQWQEGEALRGALSVPSGQLLGPEPGASRVSRGETHIPAPGGEQEREASKSR